MIITSINNEKIKEIKKLNEKKYRDLTDLFLVEGQHLVEEAYKNNCLKEVVLLENIDIDIDVPKVYVKENVIRSISNLSNINMIGICYKKLKNNIGNKVLLLDNVQDPGNLGTIIRSSVAFNLDTLIISNDSVDLFNTKVLRATQGMIFGLNIIITDIEEKIKELKNQNYQIIGTDVNDGISVNSLEKNDKICIIMGSEGNGLKNTIRELCDKFIYIKMNDKCESLNVGVATSIILYELDK